ncbi:MAG: hypothetical protein JNM25_16355 [Planctomycetes bacterium]|nr:hypothetical protein [Planctomycetota bacterium]
MVGARQLQRCVTTLWSLLSACRADDAAAVTAAAAEARVALDAAGGQLRALHLAESGGVLHANGMPLPMDVGVFGAAQGLATMLRDLQLDYICFDAGVEVDELLAWAARCAAAQRCGRPPAQRESAPLGPGVHDGARRIADEPSRAVRRRQHGLADTDSRLRSVFLQFHLMHDLAQAGPIPPSVAKVVVQAVVDRLLVVPGGLEPLVLLQRDPVLLRRSTEIAVLAVLFARVAGWPDDRLADLGGAALLCELGSALDATRPGPAGFGWLLQRGTDDFWLRCALVARWWRDDQVVGGRDGMAGAVGAALVRLAAVTAACIADGATAASIGARLRAGAGRPLADELIDVAEAALSALA